MVNVGAGIGVAVLFGTLVPVLDVAKIVVVGSIFVDSTSISL